MAVHKLTISSDYVQNWSYKEGIREFLQNALDQYEEDPGNKMSVSYDESREVLSIMNEKSVLEVKTLLLGVSGKNSHESSSRGKYGEGYKIGTLALVRSGKTVTILNYGRKERWVAKLIKSREYDTTILAFDITKSWIWEKVPDHNLTVEIGNISKDEYEDLKKSSLVLSESHTEKFRTYDGKRAILQTEEKGRVYVGGLYVCTDDRLKFSYDFSPSVVTLDRDRSMVRNFDLQWESSVAWRYYAESDSSRMDEVLNLMNEGIYDLRGLFPDEVSTSVTGMTSLSIDREVARRFVESNPGAIPIHSEDQRKKAEESGTPYVIVSSRVYHSISRSGHEVVRTNSSKSRVSTQLMSFAEEVRRSIGVKRYQRLLDMIESVKLLEGGSNNNG